MAVSNFAGNIEIDNFSRPALQPHAVFRSETCLSQCPAGTEATQRIDTQNAVFAVLQIQQAFCAAQCPFEFLARIEPVMVDRRRREDTSKAPPCAPGTSTRMSVTLNSASSYQVQCRRDDARPMTVTEKGNRTLRGQLLNQTCEIVPVATRATAKNQYINANQCRQRFVARPGKVDHLKRKIRAAVFQPLPSLAGFRIDTWRIHETPMHNDADRETGND